MADLPTPANYTALRDEILRVLQEGKERARRAVEREKVVTYKEVGRMLHAHIPAHQERAGYGERTIARLAEDIGIPERRLYEMLKFYRCFPILRPAAELGWTHYTVVLGLPEKAEREFYLREAARNGWSRRELQAQIRADAFSQAQSGAAKRIPAGEVCFTPKRGRLYTYRTLQTPEGTELDLGFQIYRPVPDGQAPGRIVRSQQDPTQPEGYRLRACSAGSDDLYAYTGTVEKVVDGDTLWVKIDCGFKTFTRQKLRLRGIDAPELPTEAGRQAREFVRAAVAGAFVVLTTTRPDKYDRYLADVFYLAGERDPERVRRRGRCLNRALLEAGLAKGFDDDS